MINETIDKEQTASPLLDISAETESYLKTSAKWGFFLAVMGYIFIFILVVIGIVLFVISTIKNEYSDFQNLPFHFPFVMVGIMYLIMAILYFFPSFNLMKFGNKIKFAFENNDQAALDEGLKNLKRLFVFFGILTIVIVSLYIVAIPVMIMIGMTKT